MIQNQTDSGSVLQRRADKIHADVLRHITDDAVPTEAKEEIEDDLAASEKALARLETPAAYRNYLADYLAEAKDALESGERDPQTEPLCSCERVYCPLKRGELPEAVVASDDPDSGVLAWKRDHRGDAAVLVEARDQFIDEIAEARSTQRQILTRLQRERE